MAAKDRQLAKQNKSLWDAALTEQSAKCLFSLVHLLG